MAALAALLTAGTNITKNFFEINTISIDNWTFKLFYKWSTTLFVFGSICVTHKQFFGDPILCDAGHASGGINGDVLDTYCWMYSTFEIPREYAGQCAAGDQEDITGLAVYNSYYQWVPLYLLVSAVFFYIPRVLWMHFEGGLMKYFGKGTRSRHIENVEATRDKLIRYFNKRVSNKYAVYFGAFMFCEILNLFVVITHFYITDRFLNNRYLSFGWDLWQYYSLPVDEQQVQWVVNPMCRTFPRVASCNYFRFGAGGDQEKINAICILALNMINDKVFALIWWWCSVLSCLGALRLLYMGVICSSAYLRFQIFNIRVNRYIKKCSKKDIIRSYIKNIPRGDWFVLYQLSKNLYRPFFMDFLTTLSIRHEAMKDDPEKGGDEDTGDNLLNMVMRPSYTVQESVMPAKND